MRRVGRVKAFFACSFALFLLQVLYSSNDELPERVQLLDYSDSSLWSSLSLLAKSVSDHSLKNIATSETIHNAQIRQRYLVCITEEGAFVHRLNSSWAHNPPSHCTSVLPPEINTTTPLNDPEAVLRGACPFISGHTTVLLGDRIQQQFLHNPSLFDDSSHYPFSTSCPSTQCHWYTLCSNTGNTTEGQAVDHPDKKHVSSFRYIQTSTLFPGTPLPHVGASLINQQRIAAKHHQLVQQFGPDRVPHRRHSEPYISKLTGIREVEIDWTPFIVDRSAWVVVMSKAPVPAPRRTYKNMHSRGPIPYQKNGREAYVDHTHLFYLDEPHPGDWEFHFTGKFDEVLSSIGWTPSLDLRGSRSPFHYFLPNRFSRALDLSHEKERMARRILDAGVHATLDYWLPALLEILDSLRSHEEIKTKRIVWRGEWFMPVGCGAVQREVQKGLHALKDAMRLEKLVGLEDVDADPWSAFHNVQVLFQSLILNLVLPYFDIPYIPLHMSVAYSQALYSMRHASATSKLICDHAAAFPQASSTFLDGLTRAFLWEESLS